MRAQPFWVPVPSQVAVRILAHGGVTLLASYLCLVPPVIIAIKRLQDWHHLDSGRSTVKPR
jgi:hypothetical protein